MKKNLQNIKPSLIIATYNWPEALELVLKSAEQQSLLPYEVLIADDGSSEATKKLIDKFKNKGVLNLRHIWHEDKGFRLAEIRNKAIKEAKGNYIIQIDGDTFLHKDFVKDHLQYAKPGQFISGSRVLLGKDLSARLLKNKEIRFSSFHKDIKNKHYKYTIPLLTKLLKKPSKDVQKVIRSVRGCNMSFWKKDLMAVNGYNEGLTGWGREDSELSARLIHLGLRKINLKFAAIQYHLYHKEASKDNLIKNHELLNETLSNKTIITNRGIEKKSIKKIPISAIIPTLNEELNIGHVIDEVKWADEILIIDSFSVDKTVNIAKDLHVEIIQRKFDDFSSQKNFAISQAKNDWIFILDADERLSDELKKDILRFQLGLKSESIVGYWIKRKNYFLNKMINFSGWQNDKVLRLFDRKKCLYNNHLVHEEVECTSQTSFLEGHLIHYTFTNKEDYKRKIYFYSRLKAQEYFKKGKKVKFFHLWVKPAYRFFFHYIYKLGFLDGKAGFIIAKINAEGMYERYKILNRLNKKN